jgi:Domain of unknown function (DUF4157)
MKATSYRRIRRSASRETATLKKNNQPEQQFFGETIHEQFFKPAASLQANTAVQRKCANCEKEDKVQRSADKKEEEKVMKKEDKKEEEKVQRSSDKKEEEKVMKKEEKKEEGKIQKKEGAASTSNTANKASNYIDSINNKGQSMDAGAQSFYESRLGANLADVKIHTGKDAADSAKDINAQAYAYRNHIVFNEGKYQPQSSEGKHLLAHELTHVLQQAGTENGILSREPEKKEFPESQRDYEDKVKAGTWCRDSASSGQLHPGKQCYREVPQGDGYPDTKQYCFDKETGVFAESSPDFSPAVNGVEDDGTCMINFVPQPFTRGGRRTAGHFISDVCTEDANLCGGGFGAAAGLLAGIGMPKHGLDSPGISSLLIPAGTAALSAYLFSKGMPGISKFAQKHGFLPSYSLSLGGSQQSVDANLGMGFEKRDKALPLPVVKTYLTLGMDTGVSADSAGVGTSVRLKLGLRLDPGEQGGLFLSGAVGAGVDFKKDITGFLSREIGAGVRFTDFMDIEIVNVKDEGDNQSTFFLKLNLTAPQKVLKGHPKEAWQ